MSDNTNFNNEYSEESVEDSSTDTTDNYTEEYSESPDNSWVEIDFSLEAVDWGGVYIKDGLF